MLSSNSTIYTLLSGLMWGILRFIFFIYRHEKLFFTAFFLQFAFAIWSLFVPQLAVNFVLPRFLLAPKVFFLVIGKFFKYYLESFLKDGYRFQHAINRTAFTFNKKSGKTRTKESQRLVEFKTFKKLKYMNSLSTKLTKWPNTLKKFFSNLPTNCLSVLGHFVGLALKGLTRTYSFIINKITRSLNIFVRKNNDFFLI